MMRFWLLAASLCVAACGSGARSGNAPSPASPTLAEVEGLPIRADEVDAEISLLPSTVREALPPAELEREVLSRLIQRKAWMQEAKRRGLDRDPIVARKLARAQETILIEALKEALRREVPPPEEAEIRNWYHAHEAEYRVPERRQVFWMLVSDKRLAQRIMRALQKRPERFRELARRYSQDAASCTTGGELGWLTADAEPRAITAKAFSVDQPGLIGPWQMPEGWAIVWVKAVEPAHTLPLEAVRDEIAAAIVEARIRARLEGIAKRAHVKQLVPDIAR